MFKKEIIKALEDKYNAEMSSADATLKIYFTKSVGIGEHPQHLEECDKLVEKMTNAEEKLNTIQKYKL